MWNPLITCGHSANEDVTLIREIAGSSVCSWCFREPQGWCSFDSYFDGVMNHRRESPAGFIRGDHVLGGGCRGARRPRSWLPFLSPLQHLCCECAV